MNDNNASSRRSDAVEYASATLAMEGMPFNENGKQMLEGFNNMTPEEQERYLKKRLSHYKTETSMNEKNHS